jgi:hypothetical protein
MSGNLSCTLVYCIHFRKREKHVNQNPKFVSLYKTIKRLCQGIIGYLCVLLLSSSIIMASWCAGRIIDREMLLKLFHDYIEFVLQALLEEWEYRHAIAGVVGQHRLLLAAAQWISSSLQARVYIAFQCSGWSLRRMSNCFWYAAQRRREDERPDKTHENHSDGKHASWTLIAISIFYYRWTTHCHCSCGPFYQLSKNARHGPWKRKGKQKVCYDDIACWKARLSRLAVSQL